MGKVSFYCKNCELDQDNFAWRHHSTIFNEDWYNSRCKKCHKKLYRLITYPEKDSYYKLSKRVIIMRDTFRKDLIQPGQEGFQLLYPQQWRKFQDELEKQELGKKVKESWYRHQYKKYSTDSSARHALRRAYELEESKL